MTEAANQCKAIMNIGKKWAVRKGVETQLGRKRNNSGNK